MNEPARTATTAPPPDPVDQRGLAGFADDLRAGRISIAAATEAYLRRIEALNPRLDAFQHVDGDRTLAQARALDALLAAGTDLGPLMGVPVAIKDILVVDGMPTTNGSKLDMSDVMGPEGAFVRALKHAGCVILGKTKTVEFAMGSTGINHVRGTPWNPWDASIHRIPGGSSSGSAPVFAPSPPAPTPAVRCACRRPCAASSASRPPRGCGPPTGSIPCARRWTQSVP